jgi:hypothetical protein
VTASRQHCEEGSLRSALDCGLLAARGIGGPGGGADANASGSDISGGAGDVSGDVGLTDLDYVVSLAHDVAVAMLHLHRWGGRAAAPCMLVSAMTTCMHVFMNLLHALRAPRAVRHKPCNLLCVDGVRSTSWPHPRGPRSRSRAARTAGAPTLLGAAAWGWGHSPNPSQSGSHAPTHALRHDPAPDHPQITHLVFLLNSQ